MSDSREQHLTRLCLEAGETATDAQINSIVDWVVEWIDADGWDEAADIALGCGCVGVYTDLRMRIFENGAEQ